MGHIITIDANNLKYTVPAPGETGNYTGVTIIPNAGIDSAAESCINIKAGASCTFTATIGAYAKPGSFTVTAIPNSSKSSVKQALNKLLGTNSISVTANLGLVDIPDFPSYFYILPDTQTITSNPNGSTTVMLSLLVKDAPEGLDNIVLVDGEESSIVLAAKPVVTPSYKVNSVNTYQVTIPAGTDIQKVRAIGYANNVPKCRFRAPTGLGAYAICSNTATINLVGTGTGILSVQPTYVNMNESYESQVITITNIGTGNATNIVYPTISAPFSVVKTTCTASLESGESCAMQLIYTPAQSGGESQFDIKYNNGKSENMQKVTTIINYGVSSRAQLSLSASTINLTNNGGFYKTITVTNVGTLPATNLQLPTIAAPLYLYPLNTCVSGQTLLPQASCSYSVAYAGGVSGSTNGQFSYSGGGTPLDLTINWQVAQQYGYLATGSSSVYKCIFDGNDNISYCLSQGTGINNTVRSLAFTDAPDGTNYLYITQSDQGVAKCLLDNDGNVTSCDIGAGTALDNSPNFGEATYITFGVVNGAKYAYISDYYGSLYSCSLKSNGDFDSCTEFDLSSVAGISFNSINGIPYLYVAGEDNSSNAGILRFALNPINGEILGDSMVVAGDAVYKNGGINIFSFNNVNYAYSGNDYNGGISCALDSNGVYTSTCNAFNGFSTSGLPYNTTAILMQTGNTYAYFGGVNNPSIKGLYRCSINQDTGALNCSLNSAVGAYSIAFGTFAATTPISITKHIFVTEGTWNGNLGGYSGADSICQSAAGEGSVTGPLGATWKALLWGNSSTTLDTGYLDTAGNFIAFASNANGNLVGYTNSLFTPINYDQNGVLITSNFDVWTGADWRNPLENFSNCNVWTSAGNGDTGFVGLSNSAGYWAFDQNGSSRNCNELKRLYCVQQ